MQDEHAEPDTYTVTSSAVAFYPTTEANQTSETASTAANLSKTNAPDDEEALLQQSFTFPRLLYIMLTDLSSSETSGGPLHDAIVSWKPHGRAFIIHDRKRFESLIMPRYVQE